MHPSHLDRVALVAGWREALLARAVLRGTTRGYRHHPQLERFRAHPAPVSAINRYLRGLADEAATRGYHFDTGKIGPVRQRALLTVTRGQLNFEFEHLRKKVEARSPDELYRLPSPANRKSHPLFRVVAGDIEGWERGAG